VAGLDRTKPRDPLTLGRVLLGALSRAGASPDPRLTSSPPPGDGKPGDRVT